MVVSVLSILLFVIFLILSGFHFYWFFGGQWGLQQVIPIKNENSKTQIPKLATLVVALILLLFGIIYLSKSQFVSLSIPEFFLLYGSWFITIVFILRAIGDFNYLGFFKKIKNTEFAKADNSIFIPLCLVIGMCGLLIEVL